MPFEETVMAEVIELSKIQEDVTKLAKEYGAENVYLFGSYARGEATPDSDIDLRIDKGSIRGLYKLAGLHMALESMLNHKVDLLTTDSLDTGFLNKISGEEIQLYGNR